MVVLNKKTIKKTILDLAKEATEGRMKTYGHPVNHFALVGRLWASYLDIEELTPQEVGLMMILFKIAREALRPTQDTKIDIAGYARTLEMLDEIKEESQQKVHVCEHPNCKYPDTFCPGEINKNAD